MGEFDITVLPALSIAASILLAAAGWYVSHLNEIRLERRKARLELVNKQLNEFYGPLYVSTIAGRVAYETLLKRLGRSEVNLKYEFLNDRDKSEWTIWLKHVFTPLNEIREHIIINNSYLFREQEMPKCLHDFVAHSAGYKAILAKWEQGDFTCLFSIIDFPVELEKYATASYRELKMEQAKLLGALH